MKTKIFYIAAVVMIVSLASCKKNSDDTAGNQQLSQTETKLKSDYQQAQNYENILVDRHNMPGMTMNDTICMMNDSLFHMNDTSFTIHMQEYCKEMMSNMGMGSNGMMGGGMMGGGTSGGMMCNMDSMMMSMNGMMNLTTFKMDSMMENHMKNCPEMGTLNANVQGFLNNMQSMRKEHMMLHK
jgi:hypothetical protein